VLVERSSHAAIRATMQVCPFAATFWMSALVWVTHYAREDG
jgi:hypothetical protein